MLKIEHDGEPGVAAIYTKTTKVTKVFPEGFQVPTAIEVPIGTDVTIRPLLMSNRDGFGHCYCWYFMEDGKGEPVKYKVKRPWHKAIQGIEYQMPKTLDEIELEMDDCCQETLTGEIVEPDGRDRFGFPPMTVMYGLC